MTAPTSEKSGAPAATLSHTVLQPQGWPIPRGYANGVMTDGGTIFTGGLVCWDAEGKFPAGFGAQAHQTFRNIRDALAAAGAGPEHLTRLTWYVTGIEDYLADAKGLAQLTAMCSASVFQPWRPWK